VKTALLLLLQMTLLVGAQAWVPSPLGLYGENAEGALKFWQECTLLSAIPFCLLVVSFSKSFLFRSLKMLWGLWFSALSAFVMLKAPIAHPEVTQWGLIVLGFSTVLGLSLALFSCFEFSKSLRTAQAQGPIAPVIPITEAPKSSRGKTVPKVEGV